MTAIEFLRTTLIELAGRTADDPLLGLAEGHFKVEVANVLLKLGCTLQEGSYASRQEGGVKIKQAFFVELIDGHFHWRSGDRAVQFEGGSTDVTVVMPLSLQLELKTRPDFGPKSQAMFDEIVPDINRVISNEKVAFLFVFDQKIYRSFSGAKTDARGAPSVYSAELAALFPELGHVPDNELTAVKRLWKGSTLDLLCFPQHLPSGIYRMFVAGILAEQVSGPERAVAEVFNNG